MSMTRRLLWLNGLAILCVVLFHAAGWSYTAMFAWVERYMPPGTPATAQVGSLGYYSLRVIDQLVVFSIPAFLFVSGSFIAISTGSSRRSLDWNSIRVRIKNLVIPYGLWTGVILVASILQGESPSAGMLLRWIILGGSNPAYYFVPLLVQFYLIAPLITPLARSKPRLLLIIGGVLQVFIYSLPYWQVLGVSAGVSGLVQSLFPKWFFPVRLFWFSLGIVVGFHQEEVKRWLSSYKWSLLGAAILLVVAGVIEWEALYDASGLVWLDHRETVLDGLLSGTMIFLILAFTRFGTALEKPLAYLGKRSYGIYLIHSPVMEYLSRGIYHLAPVILGKTGFLLLLLIGVGLGVPLLLMAVFMRSPARRIYRYVFG